MGSVSLSCPTAVASPAAITGENGCIHVASSAPASCTPRLANSWLHTIKAPSAASVRASAREGHGTRQALLTAGACR
eukprot:scaffold69993_cov63-Phaeocystis_antarctica.AAC.1